MQAPLAFLFANPLAMLITGAGAVSIPVIIHLLNRRRYHVVTWAAMRFLLAAEKKNTRRVRIEQLLLLAVRSLLLLLLVLAMASVTRWGDKFWERVMPDSGLVRNTPGRRTHHVLVLDGSFSMAARAGDTTCFERARQKALDVVRRAQPGDGFSVVVMGESPRRYIGAASNGPGPSELSDRVLAEIEALRLPHGNADLPRTLEAVADIVKQSPPRFVHREVYFFTDVQQATWIVPQPAEIKAPLQVLDEKQARTLVVDVGAGASPLNRAVTGLSLGVPVAVTNTDTPLTATVVSHGGDSGEQVKVTLKVGKAGVGEQPLQLVEKEQLTLTLARGENVVPFQHRFPAAGDYVVQVAIDADGLELDDSRTVVVPVRDTIPVLLVNGKPAPDVYDQATEYILDALNPYETSADNARGRVRVKKVSAAQFATDPVGSDLTPYDCVFVCDVPRLGESERQRLEAHVRRGGGVVFTLGPQVDLAAYNDVLFRSGQGLLPARLAGRQRAPQGYAFRFAPEEWTFKEPPLQAFSDERDRNADRLRARLLSTNFQEFIRAELPGRSHARRVLSFVAGSEVQGQAAPLSADDRAVLSVRAPALVVWQPPRIEDKKAEPPAGSLRQPALLRGRVALLTTTANTEWSDWPRQGSFVWVMQELLQHCCAGRLREQSVAVGAPLEMPIVPPSADTRVTFFLPDTRAEQTQIQSSEDGHALLWLDTDQSGVYRATIGQHPQQYLFAVNVPTQTPSGHNTESAPTRSGSDELRTTYPDWRFEIVTDPTEAPPPPRVVAAGVEEASGEVGSAVARIFLLGVLILLTLEVVLAWFFGHYSAAPSRDSQGSMWPAGPLGVLARISYAGTLLVLALVSLALAGVLIHTAWTGDFLSFLPTATREAVERAVGVAPPAPGEASRWHLEFLPWLLDRRTDPWLVGGLAVVLAGGVFVLYYLEGTARTGKLNASGMGLLLLSAGLRLGVLLLVLGVFLPQVRLWFERQSWPDVVILIDDSASMAKVDEFRDPEVKAAAERLKQVQGLSEGQRLQLAQALLLREDTDWLTQLLVRRQVKVHVYHCSGRATRLTTVAGPEGRGEAVQAVRGLKALEKNDSSQLGAAVRQVLNDFRGSALAAVVMLTDGNTTEGESLSQVAQYAAHCKVPLFLVGVGDPQEGRDLALDSLEVADTVFIQDNLIFNVNLTGKGVGEHNTTVRLIDEADGKELASQTVTVDAAGKPVKVRLEHRPTTAGEKRYVVKVDELEQEADRRNNVVRPRPSILVLEAKPIKVLYVEGYARWEYRYVKTLLERESARTKNNKSVELDVFLIDAAPEYGQEDRSAIRPYELPDRARLFGYNVVILGDVDPWPREPSKVSTFLKDLADFVREKGGGLLMIAGERHAPHAYRNTPLKDVLPIDIVEDKQPPEPEEGIVNGFRPELTPTGRMHPIFSFNERDGDQVWNKLQEMYWYSQGIQPKRAAEVLAVHPGKDGMRSKSNERPLAVQQFVGAGRSLFFGFHESWRWRWREDELRFNQFWIQTVRYLSRSQQSRVELRLDRQLYRRGEPIKITVRFPDDERAPATTENVRVQYERREKKDGPQVETNVIKLTHVPGSRATFEGLLTRTPEGAYDFGLLLPQVAGPKPQADCEVEAPRGETPAQRMNQSEMRTAAALSQGGYYTLAEADQVLEDLPGGTRMTLSRSERPWLLWNHPLLFLLAVGFLTSEWILRKLRYLL